MARMLCWFWPSDDSSLRPIIATRMAALCSDGGWWWIGHDGAPHVPEPLTMRRWAEHLAGPIDQPGRGLI